jgi:hypothetical protein
MGDDGVDLLGMSLDQSQRTHRATAGTEDHGRAGVEVGQEPGKVGGAHLRGRVLVGVVDQGEADSSLVRSISVVIMAKASRSSVVQVCYSSIFK